MSIQKMRQLFQYTHDTPTLNRKGDDVGTQYRSASSPAITLNEKRRHSSKKKHDDELQEEHFKNREQHSPIAEYTDSMNMKRFVINRPPRIMLRGLLIYRLSAANLIILELLFLLVSTQVIATLLRYWLLCGQTVCKIYF